MPPYRLFDPGPDDLTVVVTHHAPHPASIPNPNADLSCCYASDLTDLILDRGPDLWVHGRVHRAVDDVVGRTRILSKPWGHHDEQSGFVPSLLVAL